MPQTSLGFNQPIVGSPNWGGPTNANWALLNQFLTGALPLTGLNVNGNVVISGSLTAGTINGVIPAGLVTVPFGANPIFNAATGLSFKITLTGDVASSSFTNGAVGPSVIAFRIVQDGTGGHAFTWPSNVRNAGDINPGANSRSLQLFAVDTDGSLDAIGPMMYS